MDITKHNADGLLGQLFMLAFPGTTPSAAARRWLTERSAAGVTLFRAKNVGNPAQVRELVEQLQRLSASAGRRPLLIGIDQESLGRPGDRRGKETEAELLIVDEHLATFEVPG